MPKPKSNKVGHDEYDSPWKELLDHYFKQFMFFFFPDIASEINWEKGYTMLEQELRRITRKAVTGQRLADKLIRVWKQNGEETWVLVHVEVQGWQEKDFSHRTYSYNYRGHDLYNRPVVSLAVFADDNPDWRPCQYVQDLWGCQIDFRFPTSKLLDFKPQWKELEGSDNPFAIVVMAHIKTLETRKNPEDRWKSKLELAKLLYKKGFKKQDIINLYRFIDWIMALPEELDASFLKKLVKFEEKKKMRYITTAERIGIEKGIKQGEKKGKKQGIKEGKKEGIKEGKKETAKNLLKMGLDIKLICKATGLPEKDVALLQAKRRTSGKS